MAPASRHTRQLRTVGLAGPAAVLAAKASGFAPADDANPEIGARRLLKVEAGFSMALRRHIVELRFGCLLASRSAHLDGCGRLIAMVADGDLNYPSVSGRTMFIDDDTEVWRAAVALHPLRKDQDDGCADKQEADASDDPFERWRPGRGLRCGIPLWRHGHTRSRAAPAPSAPGNARTTVVITSCETD